MKIILVTFLCLFCFYSYSQERDYLKVHFLYGSKPKTKFKKTEKKWFGGIMGGHVGIEGDTNRIVNFLPNGKFHWFAKDEDKHSCFAVHAEEAFYSIFGGNPHHVKKAIVYIPVASYQKQTFDSLTTDYLSRTPYDYAFFGMRCSAAAHDILGQLNIFPDYSTRKTSRKIFYPKKLRKKVFKKAAQNNWTIVREDGSNRRKWERD